ncbi:YciE/YciF ferroxidase family protein [Segetibacter aerophilus]|uniref:Uncharacterized protein n=1 Tax=Segetibacter aerophilus TaxID=670293 RepID=A0A512BDX8_9BACT|nr:DUF892 family protein [Segetibacter aerophilus]GEO10166.1 hypothetical protein SAE01_26620 [Segetibacter aerophilus]
METLNNLVDLLSYNLHCLRATEQQVSDAIPLVIEQANHSSLKNALQHHAGLTTAQVERLNKIPTLIKEKIPGFAIPEMSDTGQAYLSQGVAGLIAEMRQLLTLDLAQEIKDAAIIASVQKIEHYEISAYGTAVAYANQLNLPTVAKLLNETLQEEYDADDLLTALATAAINKDGLPPELATDKTTPETDETGAMKDDSDDDQPKISISERTINSPGGRAGTSHRRYGSGESRGH